MATTRSRSSALEDPAQEEEEAEEEKEYNEAIGLLSVDEGLEYQFHHSKPEMTRNRSSIQNPHYSKTSAKKNKPYIWWMWIVTIGATLVCVKLFMTPKHHYQEPRGGGGGGTTTKKKSSSSARRPIVQFACPADEKRAENYDSSFEEGYAKVSENITHNMTEYLHHFRNSLFDEWGRTYEEVKHNYYSWKSTQFAPYLNNGSTIYESACGIGLNLYLTLEILHEVKGIEGITVYGNEYVDASTILANEVYDQIPPFGALKGTICTADSSDLSFVPDNMFDLVFTGYTRYVLLLLLLLPNAIQAARTASRVW
jgi:hypothetical protein